MKCSRCNGTGQADTGAPMAPHGNDYYAEPCPDCQPTERERALELAKTYHDRCPTDDGAHGIVSRQLLTEAARVDELEKEVERWEDQEVERAVCCAENEQRVKELGTEVNDLRDSCESQNLLTCAAEKERDTLRAENAVMRAALEQFDKVHFTESGASCAYGSDIAHKALSQTQPSKLMAVVDAAAEVMRAAEGRQVEAAVIVPLNNLRQALAALRGEG